MIHRAGKEEKTGPGDPEPANSIFVCSCVHRGRQALAVDMPAMAEEYLILLVAFRRPPVIGIVTEHGVILFAVVLNAYDLTDDIALRAVHVGRVFDKIGDLVAHDFYLTCRR